MDKRIEAIINNIAKEKNKSPKVIKAVIYNATSWLRENMKEMNYPSYNWPRFGKFNLLENSVYYARTRQTITSKPTQRSEGDV